MSLETGTPTADAGPSAPSAPEPTATAAAAPAAPAAAAEPVTPAQRTYTQAEMDRAAAWYRKSLQEERQRIEQQARPQEQVADPVVRELGTLKQQMTSFQLERALDAVGKRHPDFAQHEREILELVTEKRLHLVPNMPIDDMLDTAYRYWKHDEFSKLAAQPPVDIETIKRQAADDAIKGYILNKSKTAASTPRPEGAGGGTPTNGETRERRRTKRGALDAAVERITRAGELTQ